MDSLTVVVVTGRVVLDEVVVEDVVTGSVVVVVDVDVVVVGSVVEDVDVVLPSRQCEIVSTFSFDTQWMPNSHGSLIVPLSP